MLDVPTMHYGTTEGEPAVKGPNRISRTPGRDHEVCRSGDREDAGKNSAGGADPITPPANVTAPEEENGACSALDG